jgi:hypothetical protein
VVVVVVREVTVTQTLVALVVALVTAVVMIVEVQELQVKVTLEVMQALTLLHIGLQVVEEAQALLALMVTQFLVVKVATGVPGLMV